MNLLSIGGSDPSSGAGIQGDIKTAHLLGCHCLTVVTAVTMQNTARYSATAPVARGAIACQIESVMSDFEIDAIKIGMVYGPGAISAVHDALRYVKAPIVVDPVMESTTGGILLKKSAMGDFRKKIVPLAHVITPNASEAEAISGVRISGGRGAGGGVAGGWRGGAEAAAAEILRMGAKSVVITGLRGVGGRPDAVSDYVRTGSGEARISRRRVRGAETHGGGCAFSAALAIAVARGGGVEKSAGFAGDFARRSITGARAIGGGARITGGGGRGRIIWELTGGITEFVGMDNVCDAIPECQTNFVYSKRGPKSTMDVAGLYGRIVRAGAGAVVAGEVGFGGSRHVAAAVLAVNRRFPEIRSGINVRYSAGAISRLRKAGLTVLEYDRGREPKPVKEEEGASVAWGAGSAASGARSAPDVIFHRGDVGKEPMTLVFGRNPLEVVSKIAGVF